jgi:hypothetical protein
MKFDFNFLAYPPFIHSINFSMLLSHLWLLRKLKHFFLTRKVHRQLNLSILGVNLSVKPFLEQSYQQLIGHEANERKPKMNKRGEIKR